MGSLLCGLAWNNPSLVAFRVIQGLGGGMMSPLGMTMLFQVVPPQRRNTIMGFFGLPLMLAPVLGPTLGGYLVEYIDWRVIFTLNVPIGLIGLFLGFTLLRESPHVPGLKFDLRGFVLSAIGFSAMLLGLSDAATDGWTSVSVLSRFAIGIVALAAWVWVELTDDHPLLDLRLFKIPIFTFSALVSLVLTVGMFGGMLVLPLFLQNLRGLGAAESGVILMTQVLPMTIAMPLVGRLVDKVGARVVILIGLPLAGADHMADGRPGPDDQRQHDQAVAGGARGSHGPGDDALDDGRPQRRAVAPDEPRVVDEQRHAPGVRRVRHGDRGDDPAARDRPSTRPSCRRRSRPRTSRCSS